MRYPIGMQLAKCAIIGKTMFLCRKSEWARWAITIFYFFNQFLDVLWFLFWLTIGGAIVEAICSDETKQEACQGTKDAVGLWILVNLIIWLSHFVTASLLICWSIQGMNLQTARDKERKEAKAKADAEEAGRIANEQEMALTVG